MRQAVMPRLANSVAIAPHFDSEFDLVAARAEARARSEAIGDEQRVTFAALFTRKSLEFFASEVRPATKLSAPFVPLTGTLDPAADQIARGIAREVQKLPIIEALHYLTSLYAALLPGERRSKLGAYYTPPALAARLLDLAAEAGLDWRSARVLDPAAGSGALLLQSALKMRTALEGSDPAFVVAQIGARLLGLEIDPYAASLAQASLEILLAELCEFSGRPIPKLLRIRDALQEPARPVFDLVVGNPPYGRVNLTPDQRQQFSRGLYGHANLYGVFTDLALQWAKPDGLISYLTPTSMLGGQYYSSLRRLLASEAPPVAIDFVHARRGVFEDVLQETLLALYRKGVKSRRVQIHYIRIKSEATATLTRNGTVKLPPNPTQPWLAPRDPRHASLIARVEGMTSRLTDWGYQVSTGPLVWNRFKPQLRRQAAAHCLPLIWAEAITPDGQFIFRASKKNHAPYFELRPGDEWLCVRQACVLVQRTTAKEQARRLIAAELPAPFVRAHGGVVVENHLNMVWSNAKPKVSPAAVAALLNSTVADQLFRCINGSVAVSAFELAALPVPTSVQMKGVERLVAAGEQRSAVEVAISTLYGVARP